MRLALLSPLPPETSRLAQHAAQFRRVLNHAGIDVLTPLVGQRPLHSLDQAKAWVAERDWRGVDVVHAELAPGQRTVYWIMQALARLPDGPVLSATVHEPPSFLAEPIHAPFTWLYRSKWVPRWLRHTASWLASPFTMMADRKLAKRLSGLICASDAEALRLSQRLGIPKERITVAPPGLPVCGKQPMQPMPLKILCLSGPGQSNKALRDALVALSEASLTNAENAPWWQITFAGATAASCIDPPDTDPLASLKLDPVAGSVAPERIQWALDLASEELVDLMVDHHVLLMPESDRPWGLSAGEPGHTSPQAARALAVGVGRPIWIASKTGQSETIAHGNGAAYLARDPSSLGALFKAALHEDTQWIAWTNRAQNLAEQLEWPILGQRYVGFFQQVRRFSR